MDDLEYGNPEHFLGEIETMDLSDIVDKQFIVAINSGPKNKPGLIPSSIRGPVSFIEMVELVKDLYRIERLDAKVIIPSKTWQESNQYLDECTVDYIHAHALNIIAEFHLFGQYRPTQNFTCKAGTLISTDDNTEGIRPEDQKE